MSYAEILSLLLKFADKLPQLLKLIDQIVALFGDEQPATLPVVALSPDELELESQVAAAVAGPNALFDGSRLRKIAEFAKAHPELISLLLSLLKK